jgi:hypothetical protein
MGERLINHRKHSLIFSLHEIERVVSLDVDVRPHSQILTMLKVGKKVEQLHSITSVRYAVVTIY